jgi:hypothetical protein
MSTLSTAYDAIITKIESVLTSHERITNPYSLEQNSEKELTLGYGFAIGPALNSKREIGCNRYFVRRDMIISVTRKQFKKQLDVSGRSSVEKSLVEDFMSLVNSFEGFRNLGSVDVVNFEYQNDGGVEFVFGEKDNYVAIRGIFNLEYYELIN